MFYFIMSIPMINILTQTNENKNTSHNNSKNEQQELAQTATLYVKERNGG